VADRVPAVVRGPVAIRPPDGESPGRSAWGGARVARLRSAAAPIEVVTLGVDHPARGVDHRLASATGLDAAVRPRPARHRVDCGGHFWYAWLFNRTGGSVLLTLI